MRRGMENSFALAAACRPREWGPPEQGAVVARQNCILRTVVGSQLHGLMNESTDDRDEMAICTRDHELWPNSARITRPLK